MKIAIIFIGTSNYKKFFDGYYEGIMKNFLVDHQKHFFVFTDDVSDSTFDRENVTKTEIQHCKWPFITLLRFKFIRMIEKTLQEFDYIFFVDADLWCVNPVIDKEILTGKPLIGVQHPGFVGTIGTFETDTRSNANIFDDYYDVSKYRQGCLWGGKSDAFVSMIKELDEKIDDDLKSNIVTVWHDESHMNKYFLKHKEEVETLHPGFAQPQNNYELIRQNYPTKFVHLHKEMNEFPRFAGVR